MRLIIISFFWEGFWFVFRGFLCFGVIFYLLLGVVYY